MAGAHTPCRRLHRSIQSQTFNDHSQRDPRCALFGYWLQRLAGVTDYVVIDVDSARRRLLRSYF